MNGMNINIDAYKISSEIAYNNRNFQYDFHIFFYLKYGFYYMHIANSIFLINLLPLFNIFFILYYIIQFNKVCIIYFLTNSS